MNDSENTHGEMEKIYVYVRQSDRESEQQLNVCKYPNTKITMIVIGNEDNNHNGSNMIF